MRALRILAVNHLPPDAAHIGGRRVAAFAAALARRGHRVVLLTAATTTTTAEPDWDGHDWATPLHVARPPATRRALAAAREGAFPTAVNKAILGAHYLLHGGVFDDWVAGTRPLWPAVAGRFRPQVAWATFGNTGAWAIARAVARRAGCPWVMDLKDNWERFVPKPVRGATARRFADAAAATALSEAHALQVERWFGKRAAVVYSGLASSLMAPGGDADGGITLTGSVYEPASLATLFGGIAAWARGRSGPRPVLSYFGGEGEAVQAAARVLNGACEVRIEGFRPLAEMHAVQRRARVNAYIRTDKVLFHHKVFELLAAGRPVLSVPREGAEAERIAAAVGGRLLGCADPAAVRAALDAVWDAPAPGVALDRLAGYTWESQAAVLEDVLCGVAGG